MARILVLVWGFWLGALGAATADGPAEVPPAGFAARQYIDSAGCVYLRAAGGWQARRDLDGQPVCGYPPSVVAAAAGIDPAADPALAMPGMAVAEARLLAAVTGEMRPGDFVGAGPTDDRAAQAADLQEGPAATAADLLPRADPQQPKLTPAARPDSDPDFTAGADLAAAVAAAPDIAAAAAADLHPSSRLCSLIGAVPRGVGAEGPRLGGDVSQGHCTDGVIAAAGAGAGLSATGDSQVGPDASRHPSQTSRQIVSVARHKAVAQPSGGRHRSPAAREVRDGVPARRSSPKAASAPEAMIPAGARWLEVGRYADPRAADTAAARLAGAGFAVGRLSDKAGRVAVMAGPYITRQAIVAAHDRLVRSGWRGVRAR